VEHGHIGGSINHIIHHIKQGGGNITELKYQLAKLIIKPKIKKTY
jgi:hypothetical protein